MSIADERINIAIGLRNIRFENGEWMQLAHDCAE
jgi:hypothetical protein